MKYSIKVELEAGDEVRVYDEHKNRGPATIIRAESYDATEDGQWLTVQAVGETYMFFGRIENKAGALGYDRVPVFVVHR
jgi:hypothetical protein